MSETNYPGSNPGETSSFPAYGDPGRGPGGSPSSVYQVQSQPPSPSQSPRKSRSSLGGPFAIALVTALVAGGGAGYLAGSAGSSHPSIGAQESDAGRAEGESSQGELRNPTVADPAEAPAGSVEQVAATVLPAVVSIEVATPRGNAEGSGSIISSDGYVLTNHHVVAGAEAQGSKIQVSLNDGSRHSAQFIASDVNTDCLLYTSDAADE